MGARAFLVDDPGGHALTTARAAHDPAQGRVFFSAAVANPRWEERRGLQRLASLILSATGKGQESRGANRSVLRLWIFVIAWLGGENIRELFVGNAHLLTTKQRTSLCELRDLLELDLWLLSAREEFSRGGRDHATRSGIQWLDADSFLAQWDTEAKRPKRSSDGSSLIPPVPDNDFPTFRAACRDLLTPDGFAAVDELWRRTYAAVVERLRLDPDPARIGDLVRELVSEQAGPRETIVALRAIQAALFVARIHLRVRLTTFMASLEVGGQGLCDDYLERLRTLTQPIQAAIGLIALISEASARTLAGLLISDVNPDGTKIKVGQSEFAVPPNAAGILRAQLIVRAYDDEFASEYLFRSEIKHGGEGQGAATERGIRRRMQDVAARTGIPILTRQATRHRAPGTSQAWLERRGLRIRKLS